jgi:hypothetical protein
MILKKYGERNPYKGFLSLNFYWNGGNKAMNRTKLKEAEERFFIRYPGGFSDPGDVGNSKEA